MIDTAATTRGADTRLVNIGLREQVLVRGVDVAAPFLSDDLSGLLWCKRVGARAAALAESAVVNRQRMDAGRRKLRRQRIPRSTRRVAHVQQQHRRSRLGRGVIRGAQFRSV